MLFASAADLVCINAYNWHDNDPPNLFGPVFNRIDGWDVGWRGTVIDVHSVRPVRSRFWNTNDSMGIGPVEFPASSYGDVDSFFIRNEIIFAEVSYVVQSSVNDHVDICDLTINFAFMDVFRLYFLDSSDIIRTTKLALVMSSPHRSEEGGQRPPKLVFKVNLCILDDRQFVDTPLIRSSRHRPSAMKTFQEGSYATLLMYKVGEDNLRIRFTVFKDVNNLLVLDAGVTLGFTGIEGLIQRQLKKFSMIMAVQQQIEFDSLPLTIESVPVESHSSAQKSFTITPARIAEAIKKEARLKMRRYASALSESLNDS